MITRRILLETCAWVYARLTMGAHGPASSAGAGTGLLPSGVTLQAIDGESMLTPTVMSNNYYARNGFTYAAAKGWDNLTYFPIGAWQLNFYSTVDVNWFANAGMNVSVGLASNWSGAPAAFTAAGVTLIALAQTSGGKDYTTYGFTLGAETVGMETFDEPFNSAEFYFGMSTIPNSIQDNRFWSVNNTADWIAGGAPAATAGPNFPLAASWLTALQTTPNGTTRHIDFSSMDFYPISYPNTLNWASNERNYIWGMASGSSFGGGSTGGSATLVAPDVIRRGFLYGDMIDQQRYIRNLETPIINTPLTCFLETGGPDGTNTTWDSYIQPHEVNWGAWQMIIHGARAIWYFDTSFGSASGVIYGNVGNSASIAFQSPIQVATFTASGSGTTLTVTSVTGTLFLGHVIAGTGIPAGTKLVAQTNFGGFNSGGAGTYTTSQATTASGSCTATQDTSMVSQVTATNNLIKSLAKVINSPTVSGYATVSPPSGEVMPLPVPVGNAAYNTGIDILVKWDGSNFYIFASTRYSQWQSNISATFTINANAVATTATVVNESRTIPITGHQFTDTFATGATVHIYRIS